MFYRLPILILLIPAILSYPGDTTGILTISRTLYDAEGRAIVSVGPYAVGDEPVGTETVYDALGRVERTRRWANVEITLADLYAADGITVVGRKVPQNRLAQNAWEGTPSGTLAWTADGVQPVVGADTMLSYSRTEYDAAGRVYKTYTQNEDETEICTTEYVYDAAGRQIQTITLPDDVDNRTVTETHYDGTRRDYVVDQDNNITSYLYDTLGHIERTELPESGYLDSTGTPQTGTLYSHLSYDGLGRREWSVSSVPQDQQAAIPDDEIASNLYTTSSQLSGVVLPQVLIPVGEPDAGTMAYPAYRYIYDTYGNTMGILDSKGRLTVSCYDELGRQTRRYMPFVVNPATVTDAASVYAALNAESPAPACEASYYNEYGRLILSLDYKEQATAYFYNDLGRLEYKRLYSPDATPGDHWNDTYETDPGNADTEYRYVYDKLGRQDQIFINDVLHQDWDYDVEGRLVRLWTLQGTIHYDYNPVTGRKVRTWTGDTWEARDNEFEYVYDDLGRLSTVITRKRNGYPAEGVLDEQTNYAYNKGGSLKSILYPNGCYTVYWYNALHRLEKMVNFSAFQADPDTPNLAQILSQFEYQYYADGQKASVTETVDGLTRTVNWTYDNLNRLIEESVAGGQTTRYEYDLASNRRFIRDGQNQALTEYTYNAQDQLETEVSSGSTISCFYDENGSLLERVYGTNRQTDPKDIHTYNLEGRLQTFVPDGGSSVTYSYGPQGWRTGKSVGAVTTSRLIDPQNFTGYTQVLKETAGANTTVYLIGSDVHGQAVNQDSPRYLLCDSHGSVRQLSGAAIENYFYDAYGNLLTDISDAPSTNLLYTGEQVDADTGNYHLRSRDYDPVTGTFPTRDTFSGSIFEPLSLHKYLYCNGNPTNSVDPSGQFSIPSISFSMCIQSMVYAIHSLAVHQAGTRAADRYLSAYSGYLANNMPKDHDNATIIVHGVAPHQYGYSSDFITEMERRASNQDYFEYVWSGFTMNGVVPSAWAVNTTHRTATNGLVNAARAIQAKGYRNVNIISHSWGTVISRDTLNAGVGNVNTWVTMGSPLSDDTAKPGDLKYWLNIWCPGDPVVYAGKAIALTGIENPGFGYLLDSNQVNQHLKLPSEFPGLDFGNHGIYWTNPTSLNRIGIQLGGQ